jgi:hypothetical protein
MSVGIGRQNIIILFWKQQFYLWEHINDIYIGFSLALHLQCKVMCWAVAPYHSCIVRPYYILRICDDCPIYFQWRIFSADMLFPWVNKKVSGFIMAICVVYTSLCCLLSCFCFHCQRSLYFFPSFVDFFFCSRISSVFDFLLKISYFIWDISYF